MNITPLTRNVIVYLLVLLLCVMLFWLSLSISPKPLLINQSNSSYASVDRQGKLLRLSLSSDQKYRLWVPLAEVPVSLQNATLHYEDRWFYWHPGINPVALLRAVWSSLITQQHWIGASTLTMQLARQRWRLKTDHFSGKLKQMAYALWLESHFSKSQLLEAYLNLAPYGANIEGAGAAAWIYFHKPISALTEDETRALVLIPQNPQLRAPRNATALQSLHKAWQIAYGNSPGFDRLWFRQRQDLPFRAPHFSERLHSLYPAMSTLPSTLDSNIQALSEELLAGFLRQHRQDGILNASMMVVHAPTMEVLAYVGSADYFNRNIHGYVNGLKAPRSPGSTLKPFIYALAIAQGLITADTLIKDTPLRMGDYQPENFERNFYGPLSATDALIRSRNIPAISLLAQLKQPGFHQFLLDAGITIPKHAANYGLSLAIGSAEISMEDLLRLYGLLANQGEVRDLRWLATEKTANKQKPLLLPEAAFIVKDMLATNPRPDRSFGGRSFSAQQSVAWKTGTSSGLKDAWAIGISGEYLIGVWAGNFDGSANRHLVGRELVGPLLFDMVDALAIEHRGSTSADQPPVSLQRIDICPLSGRPVSTWCPHGKSGWIIPGVSPLKTCTLHRQIHINPATGLRLCAGDKGPSIERIAEFWESDELESFKQAGVQRDNPPPFQHPCDDASEQNAEANPPKIVSPQAGVSYPLRLGQQATIEFSAVSGGGRHRLFWFLDDNFIGEGATVNWPGKPGRFVISVVDDQGQSASTSLLVTPVTPS